MNEFEQKKVPLPIDHEMAKKNWEIEHPDLPWELVTTRKKNMLAKDEMFHREFRGLSDAIMNFKRKEGQ